MSVSDKEKSNVGGSGGGVNGDDDDDYRKKQRGYVYKCGGKARQVVLHPFTKAKKIFRTRKIKRASSTSASSGKRFGCGGSGKDCYFCFTKPQTSESESPTGSQTSDPNDPNFTYEKLKALIENNDFYSKECNPQN